MGLKKSRVKEGNYTLQDSGLFGIIDKDETTNLMRNSEASFPVPLNCEARRRTLAPVLKAEYWKAQAITLIRQNSYK